MSEDEKENVTILWAVLSGALMAHDNDEINKLHKEFSKLLGKLLKGE